MKRLSNEQRNEIRRRALSGEPYSVIAKAFSIASKGTISKIVHAWLQEKPEAEPHGPPNLATPAPADSELQQLLERMEQMEAEEPGEPYQSAGTYGGRCDRCETWIQGGYWRVERISGFYCSPACAEAARAARFRNLE